MHPATEAYRTAFARREGAAATADQTPLDEPGICGVLGSDDHPRGRLLVTDERAAAVLEQLLPGLHAHTINVFAGATVCRELIERAGRWQGDEVTSMVCTDLEAIPTVSLPTGLTLRAVRRLPSDPAGGVPLARAAQAAMDAEPPTGRPLSDVIASLQGLPARTHLLAAVDKESVVRATAGTSVSASDAHTYFVSTDVRWARRGVATALTAAALSWARQHGAESASLEASDAGVSIYLRLGFESVSRSTLFATRRTDAQRTSPV